MRKLLLGFAVAVSMLPVGAAQAQTTMQSQEGIALQNQILQLQQQMQQLQSGNNGGSSLGGASSNAPSSAPAPSVVTNLLNQVGQLQQQVQTLNGQVDTLQNQMNTQHDATEKEIGDLKFQMTNGGATPPPGTAPTTPGTKVPPTATAGPADLPGATAAIPATPKAALKAGQDALQHRDFKGAEANARAVLAKDKISPEGYQAGLLLAEALYAQGKPQDAAIAFDDEYNRSHTGTNAPASLLGLANSLTAIHQQAAACDTLSSLDSQFPTPPAGMAPRITAAKHRAHCS